MLFYVGWTPRPGLAAAADQQGLEIFKRWQPPAGLEVKGMWSRADGGGFCVCEASSSEVVFEASAPWAGVFLDYDIMPIVEMDKAVALLDKAIAFRKG